MDFDRVEEGWQDEDYEPVNINPSDLRPGDRQSGHERSRRLNPLDHHQATDAFSSTHGHALHPDERVVVCIDGSNLFYAALSLGLEIDYAKLLQQAIAGRRLIRAYFYTGVDPANDKQKGFLLWMQRNGFRVVTRNLTALANGERTANLDVEIAVDMVHLANHCDTIVLFSGDGDLSYAVERASYRGARFEVVSLRSMTSETLLNVADQYIDLADLAPQIQKSRRSSATTLPMGSLLADRGHYKSRTMP